MTIHTKRFANTSTVSGHATQLFRFLNRQFAPQDEIGRNPRRVGDITESALVAKPGSGVLLFVITIEHQYLQAPSLVLDYQRICATTKLPLPI